MARKTNSLKQRDTFYIITNGEQTETNYFKLLKSRRSIYNVKIEFQNDEPLELVNHAEKYLDAANQVWCVFDIDYTHKDNRLVPALNKATKIGVNIAYSNMAFEVWLISHFEKCEKILGTKDHTQILNEYLKTMGYKNVYSKADTEMLKKYFIPLYTTAIENAKVVYQKLVKAHLEKYGPNSKFPIWDWNSSTTVYKLVEALKLQN